MKALENRKTEEEIKKLKKELAKAKKNKMGRQVSYLQIKIDYLINDELLRRSSLN